MQSAVRSVSCVKRNPVSHGRGDFRLVAGENQSSYNRPTCRNAENGRVALVSLSTKLLQATRATFLVDRHFTVMFTIFTEDFSTQFELVWTPLLVDAKKVFLWEYPRIRSGTDMPVIYRHVVEISGTIHTIYVGQGRSLNGPKNASLAYQYSHGGHGTTRIKVRQFFSDRSDGWTELLHCAQIDMNSDADRLALESLLEGFYYFESRNSPDFDKQGLFYLNGHKEA